MFRATPVLLSLAIGCAPSAPEPNRAPEARIEMPGPDAAVARNTPVTVRATVEDDAPVEELTVSLVSSLDGSLDVGGPTADGTVAALLEDLSIGVHTLTLEAIDKGGKRGQDAVVVEVTGPIPAPGVAIVPQVPTTVDDLRASLIDPAPFSGMQVAWEWVQSGGVVRAPGDVLPASETARDQQWNAIVTVTDAAGQVARSGASIAIANTAPSVGSAAVAPAAPVRTDDLICSWTGWTDADGDPEAATVAWYRQLGPGPQPISGDQATRAASDLWPGDEVFCEVTPIDDALAGLPVASPAVVVGNQPPAVASVRIDAPAPARLDAVLTCVPEGATDPEGDLVGFDFEWLRDGLVVPGLTTRQIAGGLAAGDSWTCAVTPRDGWDSGPTVTSSALVIENTLPEVGAVQLAGGDTCGVWTCEATGVTDADGHSVSLSWAWAIDGVPQAETSDTLPAGLVSGGSVVTCSATPDDGWAGPGGSGGATVMSAPVAATDSPPIVEAVSLPDHGRPGDLLVCSVVASDDCTASLDITYTWTRDGTVIPGEASRTLATLGYAGGDAIQCLATVGDGGHPASTHPSPPLVLAANGWDIAGTEADALAGWSVTVADDLDGDGYREIFVGAPNRDSGTLVQAGAVYVVYGRDDVELLSLDDVASGSSGFRLAGQSGRYNLAVMGCGPWVSPAGCPTLTDVGSLSGYDIGPRGAGLGFGLGYVGDIDNDGVGDVIASAPYQLAGEGIYAGRTFVLPGTGLTRDSLWQAEIGESGYVFDAECGRRKDLDDTIGPEPPMTAANGDLAGYAVSGLGDFDGDGLGDFAVGAPNHGWADEGTIYVVYGRDDGLPVDGRDILSRGCEEDLGAMPGAGAGEVGAAVYGPDQGPSELFWHYGQTLGAAGDFDGDGYDDLFVQSPPLAYVNGGLIVRGGPDRTVLQAGSSSSPQATFVDYGNFSVVNQAPLPPLYTGQFGMGMPGGGGGDVNGDGLDDLVLQTQDYDTGAFVQVVYGRPAGGDVSLPDDRVGGTGLGFQVIDPSVAVSNNGEGAARVVGDVNGDGYDDVAVGLPIADPEERGYGVVIFGGAVPTDLTLADLQAGIGGFMVEGSVAGAHLGWSVAAGDIDGDGLDDVLFGAPGADGPASEARAGGVRVEYGRNFTASIDVYGGPGDETLQGTLGDDRLVAGRGDDRVEGFGGADVLYGGAGDDVMVVDDDSFLRVRGGAGEDALVLGAGVPSISLQALGARLGGIEQIVLDGQSFAISANDVNRLSDTSNRLILGGMVGTVTASPGDPWEDSGIVSYGDQDYYTLVAGYTELWVQVDLDTAIPPTIFDTQVVIDENPLPGATVVSDYATDPDGDDSALSYALVDDPSGAFVVDSGTGAVWVVDPSVLDFEAQGGPFLVTVQVTDEDGLQATRALKIELNDVNEPPIALGGVPAWSVEEGAPATIGSVSAVDLDAGDVLTWSVTEDLAGIFDVDPVTGDVVLLPGEVLDFETVDFYTFTVSATDLDGLSVDIPVELTVLDADVIEQDVRLNFRMRDRSLFEDTSADLSNELLVQILDSGSLASLCVQPAAEEGNWVDNWNQSLGGYVDIPFQLDVDIQGSLCANLDVAYDAGAWNADLPIDVTLQVPDNVAPGTQVTVSSSWAVDWDSAALWGNTPGLFIRGEVVADQFAMDVQGCEQITGTRCGGVTIPPMTSTLGDEFVQPVIPFVGAFDPAQGWLSTPTITQETNGFVWDTSQTWATMLALAGFPSHVGTIPFNLDNVGPNNESATARIDYVLWQALLILDIYNEFDLRLEVDGVNAELILEDGTSVPFQVGNQLQLDVPANADLDGDGLVAVSVDFDVDLQFRNEQYNWFQAGTQVWMGNFDFVLEDGDGAVVGQRTFGPVVDQSCGLFSALTAEPIAGSLFATPCLSWSTTTPYDFSAGAPADLTVQGAIQLQ